MPGPRRPHRQARFLILALVLTAPLQAHADDAATLTRSGCSAIAALVDAAAPAGAVFIPSYPTATAPALRGTAFVYDNALATIALLACHDIPRATRIGTALRLAATHDPFWHDGRIRNAYRAGPLAEGATPLPPGWWDAQAQHWDEDEYQVGTATGNVAWAALALIALNHATHDPAAAQAAQSLMGWIEHVTATPSGYAGGFFGEPPAPTRLAWVSTEHNVDAAAAFHLLGNARAAAHAAAFVAAMWDPAQRRFWLGTDGAAINRAGSAIDAELWPLIGIPNPPAAWTRVKDWVRAHHATAGGYGYRDAPDGIWTEGTAQAALILPQPGLLAILLTERAPDGLLYATPNASTRTGLALRPDSTTDDFRYFHLPHLGATAWSILAATNSNPFRPAP